MLSGLLAGAEVYRHSLSITRHIRRQLDWLIELATLLEAQDENGQPRRTRQVKQEVQAFLTKLEQETPLDTQDALVAQHMIQTIHNRWWGLFTCYGVPGLPATNNRQETFFNRLKQNQRRINGHKSVHEFVVHYGAYVLTDSA